VKKFILVILSVLVIASLLPAFGCGDTTTTATPTPSNGGVTEEILEIGCMNSLTGPIAVWGIPHQQAIEMQVDMLNEAGGIKVGDKVYKIKLLVEDDKYSAETGIGVMTKLIYQNNVKILITGLVGGAIETYANMLEQNQVVGFNGNSIVSMSADMPWLWNIIDCDLFKNAAVMVRVAADKPDAENYVQIHSDTKDGIDAGALLTHDAEQFAHWTVVADISFPEGTKDFYSVLQKALASKPDVIGVAGVFPASMGLIIKQVRELGYTGTIVWNSVIDPEVINPIAGKDNMTDVYTPYLDYNMTPELTALNDAYKALYGDYSALVPYICDMIPLRHDTRHSPGNRAGGEH